MVVNVHVTCTETKKRQKAAVTMLVNVFHLFLSVLAVFVIRLFPIKQNLL